MKFLAKLNFCMGVKAGANVAHEMWAQLIKS